MIDNTNKVFINTYINTIFSSNACIYHGKDTRGNKSKFYSAHVNACHKTGDIRYYSAAYPNYKRPSVCIQRDQLINDIIRSFLVFEFFARFYYNNFFSEKFFAM